MSDLKEFGLGAASNFVGGVAVIAFIWLFARAAKAIRKPRHLASPLASEYETVKVGVVFRPKKTSWMIGTVFFLLCLSMGVIYFFWVVTATSVPQKPFNRYLKGWEVALMTGWILALGGSRVMFWTFFTIVSAKDFRIPVTKRRYEWSRRGLFWLFWIGMIVMELTPWGACRFWDLFSDEPATSIPR